MAQRRHHYERAFEGFLRARRIPYVAVDEARKSLIPSGTSSPNSPAGPALKSFDFVIYGNQPGSSGVPGLAHSGPDGANLLIDIKGRRVGRRKSNSAATSDDALRIGRLESWVTLEDIHSLTEWEKLFGDGFQAAFVFVYACDAQPPDALFQEVFEHAGAWYALRVVTLAQYAKHMKVRSPRWGTVDIARRAFEHISQPLTAGLRAGSGLFDLGPVVPAMG